MYSEDVNVDALLNAGIISKKLDGVRLLARGAITSKINVTVNSASKTAVAAVEKAGGKVNLVA